jgi:uncharacterized protein (DUF488 family)
VEPCVITLGYEKRSIDMFVGALIANGVTQLFDLRENNNSYGRDDLNLRKFQHFLLDQGISYTHLRILGNLFRRDDNWMEEYNNCIFNAQPGSDIREALMQIANAGKQNRVALMYMELYSIDCHRLIVADWLSSQGIRIFHT